MLHCCLGMELGDGRERRTSPQQRWGVIYLQVISTLSFPSSEEVDIESAFAVLPSAEQMDNIKKEMDEHTCCWGF